MRAVETAGMVVVPREPMQHMRDRVRESGGDQFVAYANAVWPTMISAALGEKENEDDR
jgi:hypothetical protein